MHEHLFVKWFVPPIFRGVRISAHPLFLSIKNMMNWTGDSKYYVVPGQRFADEKAIVFNLDDAESFAIKTLKGGDENKSDDE